ncbi:hypothetical protein HU764_013530 [Pseudomonas sp. SWRI100]|uniref:hypothetical protein n=1 Tax=Pseudomonas TaxID=286 RepID=UPI0016451D65|nr:MULTISPECIES: hypothetical protein [Pseudomonas]MBC3495363.1 hypothetical protein [Pseudomonas sp. SWRI67]MBV4527121.1 hypothetical protein [Pseudomonas kermanshahensis]MCX2684017.1 hypothetical protein [Pseudomonas sp. DCB_AW]
MARKQETPASTTDAKDPVSTVDTSSGPSGAAGSPLSPGGAIGPASGDPGNSGVPVVAPGQAEGSNQVLPEAQMAAGTGSDVVTGGQGASAGIAAADAAASEDANQAASSLVDSSTGADSLAPEDQVKLNPATLQIYPLRSYMDEGELRRRGGPAYTVPRRHAEELVQRNLASLESLKE